MSYFVVRSKQTVAVFLSWLLIWGGFFPKVASAVELPAGTPVVLSLANDLKASEIQLGDIVRLQVASDVTVKGKTLIKTGAVATGEVTKVKKRNFVGLPAEIVITVKSVQAADGKTVFLNVSKSSEGESKLVLSIVLSLLCCILFLLMHGGDAVIPTGTILNSTTLSPVDIEV